MANTIQSVFADPDISLHNLKTYRAQGLPITYNKESTARALQSVLGLDDRNFIEVHSLANSLYGLQGKLFKVATFSFEGQCEKLPGGRNEWKFSLPVEEVGKPHTRAPRVVIDCHFQDFTPLNSLEDESQHQIE